MMYSPYHLGFFNLNSRSYLAKHTVYDIWPTYYDFMEVSNKSPLLLKRLKGKTTGSNKLKSLRV